MRKLLNKHFEKIKKVVTKWFKKVRKRFEVRKFFVRTNQTQGLSEQSADCSEEPTRRPWPIGSYIHF